MNGLNLNGLSLLNLALLLAVIASAVGVVVLRQEHRQSFVDLTRLQKQRDSLRIDYGRLQLEQATWANSERVERMAREQLGMRAPQPEEIVVVRP